MGDDRMDQVAGHQLVLTTGGGCSLVWAGYAGIDTQHSDGCDPAVAI